MSFSELNDEHISNLIARTMASWHMSSLAGDCIPSLFETLKSWYQKIPLAYSDTKNQEIFRHISMNRLWKIIVFIEIHLMEGQIRSPVVFCHNDLLAANIIYNQADDTVSFIDFEYGNYNYRGFDIANHFCEYSGLDCLYDEHYPSVRFQRDWISRYLIACNKAKSCINHSSDAGPYTSKSYVPSEQDIQNVLDEVRLFTLASHLYWGIWGLVQAECSDINFDYMNYAVKRINRLDLDLEVLFPGIIL